MGVKILQLPFLKSTAGADILFEPSGIYGIHLFSATLTSSAFCSLSLPTPLLVA